MTVSSIKDLPDCFMAFIPVPKAYMDEIMWSLGTVNLLDTGAVKDSLKALSDIIAWMETRVLQNDVICLRREQIKIQEYKIGLICVVHFLIYLKYLTISSFG